MTTPQERYRNLLQSRKLLEELCDPGRTPRVPGIIRERARGILRHYPTDWDLENMARQCPDYLDTEPFRVYNTNKI